MITTVFLVSLSLLVFITLYIAQDAYHEITIEEEPEEVHEFLVEFLEAKTIEEVRAIMKDLEQWMEQPIESYGFGSYGTEDDESLEICGWNGENTWGSLKEQDFSWGYFTGKDEDVVIDLASYAIEEDYKDTAKLKNRTYNITGVGGFPAYYNVTISAYEAMYQTVDTLFIGVTEPLPKEICLTIQDKIEELPATADGLKQDNDVEETVQAAVTFVKLPAVLILCAFFLLCGYIVTMLHMQTKEIRMYLLCGSSKIKMLQMLGLQFSLGGVLAFAAGSVLFLLMNIGGFYYFQQIHWGTYCIASGCYFIVYLSIAWGCIGCSIRRNELY